MKKSLFLLISSFTLFFPSCSAGENDCSTCLLLYKLGKNEQAFNCYKELGEKGDSLAQLNLGIFYHTGCGVEKNDVEAVKWYKLAAEKGDADAQDRLGHCYQKHTGVDEDPAKAFFWYMKAARQNHQRALYNVGICYLGGYGVEKKVDEGIRWMKKSADKGYMPAIELVNFMEANPDKVKQLKENP